MNKTLNAIDLFNLLRNTQSRLNKNLVATHTHEEVLRVFVFTLLEITEPNSDEEAATVDAVALLSSQLKASMLLTEQLAAKQGSLDGIEPALLINHDWRNMAP